MNEQLCLIKDLPEYLLTSNSHGKFSAIDEETRQRNLKGIAEARRLLAEKRRESDLLAA